MPQLVTRAFLVRATPYGESDLILSLFTESLGRVSAIARAARRSRRRFGGTLEPFSRLSVELSLRPNSDLHRLERSTCERPPLRLTSSLEAMGLGAAALELCRELIPPEHPEPDLFSALDAFLLALEGDGSHVEEALRFELAVLWAAGLSPRLDACGVCGQDLPRGRAAQFDPRRGGIVCRADGGGPMTLSGATIAGLRRLQEGGSADLLPTDAERAQGALRALVEWHLARPLRAGTFLDQVRGEITTKG